MQQRVTDFVLQSSSWDSGLSAAFAAAVELLPAQRKQCQWVVQKMKVLLLHELVDGGQAGREAIGQ